MDVRTAYQEKDRGDFEHYKRRSKGKWEFLASGEWSQSPYHQGKHSFHIRCDSSRRYWALLSVGFPNRIIATAHTLDQQAVEAVAVAMLRAVRREDGGDYINTLDSTGRIDRTLFWSGYRAKETSAQQG